MESASDSLWAFCPDCGMEFGHGHDGAGIQPKIDEKENIPGNRTSWIRGMFSWNWKNFLGGRGGGSSSVFEEKRKNGCSVTDECVCSSWGTTGTDSPKCKRMKHTCLKLNPKEVFDWQKKINLTREYQEQYKSTVYSSSDSDRLNLNAFLLPSLTKTERIAMWLDRLEHNMQNTCTEDCTDENDSCGPKTGVLEKKKELILNYIVKSTEEVTKLQKALQLHADSREKEFLLLTGLTKSSEELKSEITECSAKQRKLLEEFVYKSSRLDIEFDVEERMLATQAEENLQKIQDKLCTDIVKRESSSMVRLFSG